MKLYYYLLNLLFPPKCILCGKLLERNEQDLCRDCRVDSPEYPDRKEKFQFLDSFTAVWYYEGNVRRSLLRYKFYNSRSFASGYGRLLAMKLLQSNPDGFDTLTWVPVSRLRKFTRGFDQAERLARAVGKELGIQPVCMLRKIRNNPRQSGIHRQAQRRANVLGVYQAVNDSQIQGKRVLLLDDILTTGATAGECARVLLTAGAKEVHCAVMAASRK